MIPATITTEVLEHADGRPIAYVDATAVAVFVYQEPDGTHVIDIRTREDIPPGRLRLILDGQPLDEATVGDQPAVVGVLLKEDLAGPVI